MINTYRWRMKNFVNDNEFFFRLLAKKTTKREKTFIDQNTDIVIEGYPRSANTFCVASFQYMQNKSISVASHRHELGQVLCALKMDLPVIILIREPKQAVSSFVIRENISIKYALHYYIKYYNKILANLNYFVIGDFHDIIKNIDIVIERINIKYKTDFNYFPLKKWDILNIKSIIIDMEKKDSGGNKVRKTHIAYPDKSRDASKQLIISVIENKYNTLLLEAEEIYNEIISQK